MESSPRESDAGMNDRKPPRPWGSPSSLLLVCTRKTLDPPVHVPKAVGLGLAQTIQLSRLQTNDIQKRHQTPYRALKVQPHLPLTSRHLALTSALQCLHLPVVPPHTCRLGFFPEAAWLSVPCIS